MYRPLSPHVFIYKPQFCSVFSVFHRVTGATLALGLLGLGLGLCLSLISPFRAHFITYLMSCYINTYLAGMNVAVGAILVFSFFYHLLHGIRHLFWDFFIDPSKDDKTMYFVVALVPMICAFVLL